MEVKDWIGLLKKINEDKNTQAIYISDFGLNDTADQRIHIVGSKVA